MSFINSIFLFGLAAMALPVLFHFVRKMTVKREVFGSLMFLSATPKEMVRKRRLRDILLMAIRAGIVGLLALAFARPFLPPQLIPFASDENAESVVYLIDQSFSMGEGDRFERAIAEVGSRIDAAGPDDESAIVVFSDAAEQLSAFDVGPDVHKTVLGTLDDPSFRTTDFYQPIRFAEELLSEAKNRKQRIVLLSDLQSSGWSGSFDNWKLSPGVQFEPVFVGSDEPENAWIDEAGIQLRRRGDAVTARFDARVEIGSIANNDLTLTLDEREVDQKDLAEGGPSRLSFQRSLSRDGLFQGQLSLSDDALVADNNHFFTMVVRPRTSVLAVDGSGRGRGDAFYLQSAFDFGDAALYDFVSGSRADLSRLRDTRLVFISNVNALTDVEQNRLRTHIEQGGHAIVSFGGNSRIASWRSFLTNFGIGSAGDLVSPSQIQSAPAIVAEIDRYHPAMAPLADASSALLQPRFRRYLRISPDSSASVLASFDTGDPFLIESRLGDGSLIVNTSAFGTSWTDLQVNGIFVPLVYQLARYAAESTERTAGFAVGDPVLLTGRPGETWEVRDPDGDIFRVELESETASSRSTVGYFTETNLPGHYLAVKGTERYAFSVNVDPAESLLASRDVNEAYATVAPPAVESEPGAEVAGLIPAEEEKSQKFWRILILIALALVVVETLLANRLGSGNSRKMKGAS